MVFAEGLALGEDLGLDLNKMLDVWGASAAGHPMISTKYDEIRGTSDSPGFAIERALLFVDLAEELGPAGINVTVVHPGLTRTERTAAVVAARAASAGVSEAEVEAQMASGNLVRQLIDANDIANIVAFLASPKSVAI